MVSFRQEEGTTWPQVRRKGPGTPASLNTATKASIRHGDWPQAEDRKGVTHNFKGRKKTHLKNKKEIRNQ